MPETLTLEPRLRKIIEDVLGVVGFAPEASLSDDLGASSLDLVELAMVVEDEFNIEITDEDVDRWNTAGDVLGCVEGKRHG